jgi:hypothetical protein
MAIFTEDQKVEPLQERTPEPEVTEAINPATIEFIEALGVVEGEMAKVEGATYGDECCPLKHSFGDGLYIREITMPKGMLVTSKIHKTTHPYFVVSGDVSVQTDKGIVRIKGPCWGITQAGTKRLLYLHEETVWVTVHATQETDLEKIEEQLIAKDTKELLASQDKEHLMDNRREALPCHGRQ